MTSSLGENDSMSEALVVLGMHIKKVRRQLEIKEKYPETLPSCFDGIYNHASVGVHRISTYTDRNRSYCLVL